MVSIQSAEMSSKRRQTPLMLSGYSASQNRVYVLFITDGRSVLVGKLKALSACQLCFFFFLLLLLPLVCLEKE